MAFGPGSIAFTGYSADSADAVSFVTLTDMPAGTVIYFHQGKWDGDSFKNGGGSHWSWTATSDVPAGSVVNIAMSASAPPTSNIGSLAVQSSGGTISLYLADALYAYVGASNAPEAFLAAISPKDFLGQSYDPLTLAGTGLVEGETAVALGTTLPSGFAEIGAYDGPRLGSGSFADYLALINDPANWISQSAPGTEASDGVGPDVPFSLAGFSDDPNAQSVSFAADSLQITQAEGDSGDTLFTYTVTRTGGTTGTIHFTGSIGLAGLTGADDFGGTVPLNFSGTIAEGQSSGTFTVRVSGDMQFERSEIFKLLLQTVTNVGGPDAVLGEDTLAGGTVVNDDPAQTSIAFVGINTDGGDNLAFVAVSGIAAGTVIYFSDNAWNGSAFTGSESVWSWTAGSDIPAGTVITMDKLNVAGAASSNHGTISFITGSSANLDENNLVEQVYAYLGAPGQPSAFLTAISNGALSLTGTGLTVGVDALALTPAGSDIAYYNGPRTGMTTMEEYLAAINNPANWLKQDTSADNANDGILPELPFPAHSFSTDPNVQVVQFAAGSLNLAKSEGQNGTETAFTFTIERTGGTTGDVAFSVRVPAGTYATAANGADFVGGALPMITGTIPAGASSTTVTILVKGDGLFEVAERFLLVLESASNPNASSIVVGNDSIAAGTINNDDSAPTKILAGETHSALINVATQLVIDQGGSLVVPTGNAINWQSASANVVIENSGLIGGGITSANNNGGSFTLNNQATGVIRGVIDLGSVKAGTPVTLNNAGRIELTTDRMDLRDAKAGPIVVNNLAGGLILQTTVTPDVLRPGAGSVVNNYGTIKHADGLVGGGDGVDLAADAGNVNNYAGGVIEASRHAVTGDGKMRVYNEGTMIGRNGSAVNMDNDGTEAERAVIINRGTMEGRSANLADSDGDAIDIDGLLTLDNYGRVAGLGHNGYHDGEPNVSEGIAIGGGIIRNYAGGEIYGHGRAIQIDNSSNANALGASTITNEGLIRGAGNLPTNVTPAEIALFAERMRGGEAINIVGSFGDTLTNSGTIIGGVKMGGGDDVLTNSGTMTATGGSAIDMGDGNDRVTLEADGEVAGAILLGAGNDTLTAVSGDIEIDGGAGNDTITSGEGDDIVFGGAGDDVLDGGEGDDILSGDDGDDVLKGGVGDDALIGGIGNDVLFGGEGDDDLIGGEGVDTVDYSDAAAAIVVDLAANAAEGDTIGSDTLTGIENVVGGAGNDLITGDDLANVIDGGAGNDTLNGGAGDDLILAGAGDDVIDGGAGFDTLDLSGLTGPLSLDFARGLVSGAGIGSDRFSNIEQVLFGAGDDVLTGGNGNDAFDGGAGNDTLKGGAGDDTLSGGEGDDLLDGGSGNDALDGGNGIDTIKAGSGDDTIDAGAGNDIIDAGSDNDIVLAGAGDDSVDGGSGDDRLTGSVGDDALTGGSGHDVFVFAAGFGKDAIADFRTTGSSSDVIEFATNVFADFGAAIGAAHQVGADTVFTIDAGTALTLKNVQLASLHADDFHFV
ncbi:hypothetical protein [Bosea sp. BK604]|uniref:hypothetical protein n=1 Tax=Bosea sp. BK604 TaxID=2512180 RepID=UPI0010440483|nr:hypothetical protein [Bosea sp. BK604]TCR63686.1 Ca2+-binding RTX toxin-like protein [Bosea sp. BK604]